MNKLQLMASIATLGLVTACSGPADDNANAEGVSVADAATPATVRADGRVAAPPEPAVYDEEEHGHSHDEGEEPR